MTWMDLYILLKNMVETKHTSLTDTPQEKVTIIVDNEEFCVDIFESLTTGKITLVLATMFGEEDDAE